ncbi:MAG: hypothetical protein ABJN26_06990 [Stappiaceae bacterium]
MNWLKRKMCLLTILSAGMVGFDLSPVMATGPTIYRPPTNTDLLSRQQRDIRQLQNRLDQRNRQELEANRKAQAARKQRDLETEYSLCRARNIDKKDCLP